MSEGYLMQYHALQIQPGDTLHQPLTKFGLVIDRVF